MINTVGARIHHYKRSIVHALYSDIVLGINYHRYGYYI